MTEFSLKWPRYHLHANSITTDLISRHGSGAIPISDLHLRPLLEVRNVRLESFQRHRSGISLRCQFIVEQCHIFHMAMGKQVRRAWSSHFLNFLFHQLSASNGSDRRRRGISTFEVKSSTVYRSATTLRHRNTVSAEDRQRDSPWTDTI